MARTPTPPTVPSYPVQVIRAGASPILKVGSGRATPIKREKWQDDAWDVYDLIGEIKQGTNFLADVCASTRVYIAVRPTSDESEPRPAEPSDVGAAEAQALLERMQTGSVDGGVPGLIRETVINWKITGDGFVMAEQEKPPKADGKTLAERMGTPERWSILSVSECETEGEKGKVRETPGADWREVKLIPADGTLADDPDLVFLLRVWQRHPRYGGLADCMMRALLTESDELILLGRAIRGAALSRLAGAGILVIPQEYSFATTGADEGDPTEDPEVDPLTRRLGQAMLNPIQDESSPDGLVPIVLRAPADVMKNAPIQHLTFDRKMDETAAANRTELLGRIGNSSDIPFEQVTGMSDINHWGARQIDTATWGRYGHPTMRAIMEAWTQGILVPMLDAAGVEAAAVQRLMFWFDPADAIVDPDESKTADELFDRLAISWEAYRQRKGAGEDEAPTPEEMQLRVDLGLVKGQMPSAGNAGGTVPVTSSVAPDAYARALGFGSAAELDAVLAARPDPQRRLALAAAARDQRPIGMQLGAIDEKLRIQLAEVAELAITRALERAGARIRQNSRKNEALRSAIADVPAMLVPAQVGPTMVAAIGLTDDQLLEGQVDSYRDRIDARIRQAQTATRKALRRRFRDMDDAEEEQLQARQDRDRGEAVAWFVAALTTLSHDRLFDPHPAAPAVGEVTASSTVPPSLVREAMARAGGGFPPEGEPLGGVATGVDVMAVWSAHGATVAGYVWQHGDPDRPLLGHEGLADVEFSGWSDPVLAVQEQDAWLGRDFYQPGDHGGCTCNFFPIDASGAEPEDTGE